MRKTLSGLLLFMLCGVIHAESASEYETRFGYSDRYGVVTPAHVYRLMYAFENSLMIYAQQSKPDRLPAMNAIRSAEVTGRTPDDVFDVANEIADELDKLNGTNNVNRMRKQDSLAIPAEVFIQTGNNLDFLVQTIGELASNSVQLGELYHSPVIQRKMTPSHVYALATVQLERLRVLNESR